jgi:hypothetical protein
MALALMITPSRNTGGAGRMAGTGRDVFQTGVPGGDLSSGAASAG